MASSHRGGRRGGRGRGRGIDYQVGNMGTIHQAGRTFFDEKSIKLYHDLENRHVIGLKYYAIEYFMGNFQVISQLIGTYGFTNLCQVKELVYHDLVRQCLNNQ